MLSIIIPFVVEMPQLLFTVQSLTYELRDRCDYEILCVDNKIPSIFESDHSELNGSIYIQKKIDAGVLPNVRLLKYPNALSHWGAKNFAVDNAAGDTLLFLDAHVLTQPGCIYDMYHVYQQFALHREGSLHLPISYMLDNKIRLVYELVYEPDKGKVDYRFKPMELTNREVMRVPCMSTCGMLISKYLLVDVLKKWPDELGSYSGGEQYINFTMAVLGLKKYIYCLGDLQHYAAPRAYEMDPFDVARNKAIATFLFGGHELMTLFVNDLKNRVRDKLSLRQINKLLYDLTAEPALISRREYIKENTVEDIKSWCIKIVDKQ